MVYYCCTSMPEPAQPVSNIPANFGLSNQTIIPPEVPAEMPKKEKSVRIPPYLIVIAVVYILVLYGFFGYVLLKKNNLKNSNANTTTAQPSTSPALPQILEQAKTSSASSRGFSDVELSKLPLIDLTTNWIDWYEPETQPQYMNMVVPKDLIQKVSVYKIGAFYYLAPSYWYGDGDISTQFGTTSRLFPDKDFNEKRERILTFFSDKSPREALVVGAQFFPWIREHAKELGVGDAILPVSSVATVSAITSHLVTYSSIEYDTYELLGVIFCDADKHLQDRQWQTMQLEVRLSREKRSYGEQLINAFIDQYDLKNK